MPSSSFISSSSSHLLFRLIVFRRSSSHHLIRHLIPVVVSFVPPSSFLIAACAVFACSLLLVLVFLVPSSPVVARLIISSVISSPPLSHLSSCRLVRRFACSSLVVPLLVPPRRLVSHSSARPRSPFLDTAGRGVLPFDGDGPGKQARGRAGRWIARGVASKQTRRATIGRYEDAPPHLRDGAGRRGVSFFFS